MMIAGITSFSHLITAQSFRKREKTSYDQNNKGENDIEKEIEEKYKNITSIISKIDFLKRTHQEKSPQYEEAEAEMNTLYKEIVVLKSGIFNNSKKA